MLDPTEVLEHERRQMGRGVTLVNAQSMVSGSVEVMTILYNCDPIDVGNLGLSYEQRAAIIATEDGETTSRTSIITQTRYERPDDGGQ